jgi:type IV pilus assembly protein PilE
MHSRKYQKGVNLIELMIVVTIVAILSAIAYPSYRNQLLRSHRAEAKAAVLQVQVAQEKFFLQNNSYAAAPNTAGLGLGYTSATPNTTNGYYQLSFSNTSATTYTVTAEANASQDDDTSCDKFTVTQTGARGALDSTGTANDAECW